MDQYSIASGCKSNASQHHLALHPAVDARLGGEFAAQQGERAVVARAQFRRQAEDFGEEAAVEFVAGGGSVMLRRSSR